MTKGRSSAAPGVSKFEASEAEFSHGCRDRFPTVRGNMANGLHCQNRKNDIVPSKVICRWQKEFVRCTFLLLSLLTVTTGCTAESKVKAPEELRQSASNQPQPSGEQDHLPAEQPKQPRKIQIAAASDLRFALEDVKQEFQKKHPDTAVQVTFGASGTLFAQLTNAAPFDLFLSADLQFPQKLIEQGHADEATQFKYAVGHIVLWGRQDLKSDLQAEGIAIVTNPSVRKIAIANPKLAPYGRAAEAALKNLEVYDKIKDKLVLGENVTQTAQFVESGAAEIGLISLSLAQSPALRNNGQFWRIPETMYPKLEQGGVIPKQCRDVPMTQAFIAFLTSPEGGTILKKYGFDLPGE